MMKITLSAALYLAAGITLCAVMARMAEESDAGAATTVIAETEGSAS